MDETRTRLSPKDDHLAATLLRAYWEEGRRSLKEHGDRVKYGHSSERLRKARVFAQRYTEEQLQRLVDKCVKHRAPLGTSFVDRLATIHDKRERASMETKVVAEGWSRGQLDREIRSRYGSRRKLGRNPTHPQSAEEALSDLVRLGMKLTRWGAMMGWQAETGRIEASIDAGITSLADLPDDVVSEAQKALRAAQRLQEAAEAALVKTRG